MTASGNGAERPQQVVVVGPDGQPVGALALPQGDADGQDGSLGDMVEQPMDFSFQRQIDDSVRPILTLQRRCWFLGRPFAFSR